MAFVPLKVGEPANDLLKLNYLFNKADRETRVPADIRFARMWHSDATTLVGPTIVHSGVPDVFPYRSYWRNFPLATDGNKFRQYFALSAGTYDFIVMANTYNAAGRLDIDIDGVLIGGLELYSAVEVDKAIFTISNVVIATDGEHELIGETKGKHASSTGYNIRLYKYFFREA